MLFVSMRGHGRSLCDSSALHSHYQMGFSLSLLFPLLGETECLNQMCLLAHLLMSLKKTGDHAWLDVILKLG